MIFRRNNVQENNCHAIIMCILFFCKDPDSLSFSFECCEEGSLKIHINLLKSRHLNLYQYVPKHKELICNKQIAFFLYYISYYKRTHIFHKVSVLNTTHSAIYMQVCQCKAHFIRFKRVSIFFFFWKCVKFPRLSAMMSF